MANPVKPFNLYEIVSVFELMRERCYKHQTIGVLDKKTARCLYIGHVNHLPRLIDEQIDLQQALFIPDSGYARTGRFWDAKHFSKDEVETVVREYIPELLSLFQSLEYPFSKKDQNAFDKALDALDDASGGILPFGYGFFSFVDVYHWCCENKIPLLEPKKARALLAGWHEGFTGHVDYDAQAGVYRGKVIGCTGTVTFQSQNPSDLQKEFKTSVDRYLKHCKANNIVPYPYDT